MSTRTGDAGHDERGPVSMPSSAMRGVAAFAIVWVTAGFASSVVLVIGGSSADPPPIPALAASLIAGWTVFLVGAWWTSRALYSGDVRTDYALRARPVDAAAALIGVAVQLVAVPLVYVPLREIWPATFDDRALSETAEELVDRADGAMIFVLFLLVVVGAPVVEEITYRGFLQRPLLAHFPPGAVITVVAAVFALVHFRPVEYPGLFVAGLVFGALAWWTGRIGTAIAAHVGFNAIGLWLAL